MAMCMTVCANLSLHQPTLVALLNNMLAGIRRLLMPSN